MFVPVSRAQRDKDQDQNLRVVRDTDVRDPAHVVRYAEPDPQSRD